MAPVNLEDLLDMLAGLIAPRLAAVLAPQAPPRIPLENVAEHGAPSARWVRAKAAPGTIRGPRGARYILAADLDTLLAGSTIRRRDAAAAPAPVDARAAVEELAARRVARERRKAS